jgi:spoIIIJ-associated protein
MTNQEAPSEATEELRRLEQDGEIAADYLEELLDIADLDGDIDIDVENGRAVVAIVSDDPADSDLQRLVGKDGAVLDALQDLTRLAVQSKTGQYTRLMLDVGGYRAERRAAVQALAEEAIAEAKAKGTEVSMKPMNAFERKAVHDAVAAAGLTSESSGADPERYVVIRPA